MKRNKINIDVVNYTDAALEQLNKLIVNELNARLRAKSLQAAATIQRGDIVSIVSEKANTYYLVTKVHRVNASIIDVARNKAYRAKTGMLVQHKFNELSKSVQSQIESARKHWAYTA